MSCAAGLNACMFSCMCEPHATDDVLGFRLLRLRLGQSLSCEACGNTAGLRDVYIYDRTESRNISNMKCKPDPTGSSMRGLRGYDEHWWFVRVRSHGGQSVLKATLMKKS